MKVIKAILLLFFLSILHAQAATDCSQVTEIPQVECEALIALYNSTDGDNWKNNSGWNVNDTPCSWDGITCNGGYVVRIDLSSNQLSGEIPPELGQLSNLQSLILSFNWLSGGSS